MDERRGVVFIAPESAHVPNGRLVDPRGFTFLVSWQIRDDDSSGDMDENTTASDAEEAVAWGRERSDRVLIRLGHVQGTYFSAGAIVVSDGTGRDIPAWPPSEPPEGWWTNTDEEAADAAQLEWARDPRHQWQPIRLPDHPTEPNDWG